MYLFIWREKVTYPINQIGSRSGLAFGVKCLKRTQGIWFVYEEKEVTFLGSRCENISRISLENWITKDFFNRKIVGDWIYSGLSVYQDIYAVFIAELGYILKAYEMKI